MKDSIVESPLISILVPVYNVENYLAQCLNSLLNQTYDNLEIICVNDGSTDGSLQILKEFEEKDARIILIDKNNEGVSRARNTALRKASGDFLMFVDADDWVEKETCKSALDIQQRTEADVVLWPYISEHKQTSVSKKIFSEDEIIFEEDEVKERLHRRFVGLVNEELRYPEKADALSPVWGKLYRRELISDQGIEFVDLKEIGTYEDGLFNLEAFYHVKKAVYVQKFFYHYRRTNVSSETSGYKEKLPEQWGYLYQIMERYINEKELPVVYHEALKNRISLGILGLGLNLMGSPMKQRQKIAEIKGLLSRPVYRNAVRDLNLKYFPVHWKMFYGCAKWNCASGIFVLLFAIRKMIQ